MFVLRCRWFLKPVSTRFSPVVYSAQYTKILQKKPKSSAVQPETCSPPSAPLSPEQLDRMARNKRAALEKLASAQTPPGFGESWREGLSAEFGKPYFKQVRGRVVNTFSVSLLFVLNWLMNCHRFHSWWSLFLKRGNATQCIHLLIMSSPGHRRVTSKM